MSGSVAERFLQGLSRLATKASHGRLAWIHGLLLIACCVLLHDRLAPRELRMRTVAKVDLVDVNESTRRNRNVQHWAVVHLTGGGTLEHASGVGVFHVGDTLEVEERPWTGEVCRYRFTRGLGSAWNNLIRANDDQESTVVLGVVALLSALLLLPWWNPSARVALQGVQIVFLIVWFVYLLGAHGVRLLAP